MRLAAPLLAALCLLALGACGNTVQRQPISHSLLEDLVIAPYPVYWLGGSFRGMAITEATHDPSGAFTVQYGDCLKGGQGACVSPLSVVSSPDNSFLPGGSAPSEASSIRGIRALIAQAGRAIVIPTGSVVIDIYADSPALAAAAAHATVPINATATPQAPLPARLPDTGFGATPLASQTPSPLGPLRY